MFDPARHPAFAPVRDPASGTESWHLAWDGAPVQRPLYYTNPSISADGRWLWFTVGFPPNPACFLARIGLDPAEAAPRWFPQADIEQNTAAVCPAGDAAWFAHRGVVHRIDHAGRCERLGALPDELVAGRTVFRTATHLTVSADGSHLALDSQIGGESVLSLLDLASGVVTPVCTFNGHHNHAQFSRHDPDQLLIAQDQHRDPLSGRFVHHRLRTHLIRRDGSGYRCINPEFPCAPYRGACHEWWLADGRIAFVDYATGVRAYDPVTGRWLSRDPIGEEGGLNLYGYAANSPVMNVDVDGLYVVAFFDRTTGRLNIWDSDRGAVPTQGPGGGWNVPRPADLSCNAFSGEGANRNNPAAEGVPDSGPIPAGRYAIRPGSDRIDIMRNPRGNNWWYQLWGDGGGAHGFSYQNAAANGRGAFNLHVGLVSHGCVTVPSTVPGGAGNYPQSAVYDRIRQMLDNTSRFNHGGTTYVGVIYVR